MTTLGRNGLVLISLVAPRKTVLVVKTLSVAYIQKAYKNDRCQRNEYQVPDLYNIELE
jgi:hypothetical protein